MLKVFHCKVHSQKFTAKRAITLFCRFQLSRKNKREFVAAVAVAVAKLHLQLCPMHQRPVKTGRRVQDVQVARVTGRNGGSSVCKACSSVFFSEGVPCGMSVAEDAREFCLGC